MRHKHTDKRDRESLKEARSRSEKIAHRLSLKYRVKIVKPEKERAR